MTPALAFSVPQAASLPRSPFTGSSLSRSPLQRPVSLPLPRSRRARTVCLLHRGKPANKSILVFGGGSTLGKEVVAQFSAASWRVYTLDFYDASVECGGVNGCALPRDTHVPISLALPAGAPARIQVDLAHKCLTSSCADKFDVVLNATLGFVAAGLGDADLFETSEYMYRTSVESSLVTAKLASAFMKEGGMLSFIGSVAALPGTTGPRMLGFGAAKASVHQMVRLLGGSVGSDLPRGAAVVAVVPEVLDTPLHRSMNSGVIEDNWTPCDVVASKLLDWAQKEDARPPNASLVSVATQRGAAVGVGANEIGKASSRGDSEHTFRLIQDSSFVQSTPL